MTDNAINTVTVSVTVKKSITRYENAEVGAIYTMALPDGATDNDFAGQQKLMYEMLKSALVEQVADLVAQFNGGDAEQTPAGTQQAPPPMNELDAHFGPKPERKAPPQQQDNEAGQGGGNRLQYAPKADERQPGQWWVDEATHYEYEDYTTRSGDATERLRLYKDGLDFPIATIYKGSPAWPSDAWLNAMTKDGARQKFGKTVYVVQEVADKKNNRNNYYVNVTTLTTMPVEEPAA